MTTLCPIQWIDVNSPNGPALKDHAGTIVGNYLYVHGGQTDRRNSLNAAHNGLYRIQLSPSIGAWNELTTADSPALSQHVCIGINNKYLVFIGGWTGRTRIPGVHTFDVETQRWLPPAVSEPLLRGFPTGAGLSAHTVTEMRTSDSKPGSFAALIIGREGSLRTQRKAGNIYLLYGNVKSGGTGDATACYTYCEANPKLTTSSRSYHTSTAVSPTTLATIGGRKDHLTELLSWKCGKDRGICDWPGPLVFPPATCSLVTDLMCDLRHNKIEAIEATIRNQCGWRGHSAVPGIGGIFVSGGDGFNALVRDPLDSAYMYTYDESQNSGVLYHLGKLKHPRCYAVMAVNPTDGTAWIHGGLGPGGRTQSTLLRLDRVDRLSRSEEL